MFVQVQVNLPTQTLVFYLFCLFPFDFLLYLPTFAKILQFILWSNWISFSEYYSVTLFNTVNKDGTHTTGNIPTVIFQIWYKCYTCNHLSSKLPVKATTTSVEAWFVISLIIGESKECWMQENLLIFARECKQLIINYQLHHCASIISYTTLSVHRWFACVCYHIVTRGP